MKCAHLVMDRLKRIGITIISVTVLAACTVSWKEEVCLHDGSKFIVDRAHTYGTIGGPDQGFLITECTTTFIVPGTTKRVTWKSQYGGVEKNNLILMILEIVGDTPYVAASMWKNQHWEKWGYPNPPYLFFKYNGSTWERISLDDFPAGFKDANVIIDTKANIKTTTHDPIACEDVTRINSSLVEEYRTVSRVPLPNWKRPQ